MAVKIDNRLMRRLWLDVNGLLTSQDTKLDIMEIINKLGFVQLDTIQNISRAHHHIIWSRHSDYREHMLDDLIGKEEGVFEHFTHDASILPMEFYPMWRRNFDRFKVRIEKSSYHNPQNVKDWKDTLIERISAEGSLSTKDFESKITGKKEAWARPPHKRVLDYLWYTGVLTTSHRVKFTKFYDLAERIIPKTHMENLLSERKQVDWLCEAALKRLTIATAKEIKEFWDAKDIKEVHDWIERNSDKLVQVEWETANGNWMSAYAFKDIEEKITQLPDVSPEIRIINPFDPAVRNRTRLENIFGFEYRLEVFVPEAKRKWGYYVYPILEGDNFIGRIEAKADRKKKCLNVNNFWLEPGQKLKVKQKKKLETELRNLAKLAELESVNWV
ncbi:winged helix-turn-helix domain-containing protein [Curvivirga aplysinae]|uniref:winged helix-turn-helix domain-containing protein n=1 Tax=Curvivirga aplysinae TaxID=2529852 RepID=UPI001C3FBD1C|nr:crosslink repair DNA glycosylase YcaQ family protein [Curvivirga aplysinae]